LDGARNGWIQMGAHDLMAQKWYDVLDEGRIQAAGDE
jgi:hypothetical protein